MEGVVWVVAKCLEAIRNTQPVIHCITNYVSMTDCANGLLAIGASPVMAEAKEEVAHITGLSDSLLLNTGMLSSEKLISMRLSGICAKEKGIPIVLDPVGVAKSP